MTLTVWVFRSTWTCSTPTTRLALVVTRGIQLLQVTVGTWKLTVLRLPAWPAELLVADAAVEPEAVIAAQPTTAGTTTWVRTIRRHILFTVAPIYPALSSSSCGVGFSHRPHGPRTHLVEPGDHEVVDSQVEDEEETHRQQEPKVEKSSLLVGRTASLALTE